MKTALAMVSLGEPRKFLLKPTEGGASRLARIARMFRPSWSEDD